MGQDKTDLGNCRPKVMFISPFPLPNSGVANVMQGFWDSELQQYCRLLRLNIRRKAPANIRSRLKLRNIISCLYQWFLAFFICAHKRPQIVNVVYTSRFAILKSCGFAVIAKTFGAKVVAHLHGGAYDRLYRQQPKWVQALTRKAMHIPDRWVVSGNHWRDFLITLGIKHYIISLIYNPQRKEVLLTAPKTSYDIDNGIPQLLFVGSITWRKGVDMLLEVLERLYCDSFVTHITLLGGEENIGERGFYMREFANHLPDDSFQFVKHLEGEAYFDLLRASDIFILPSRNENFPMALCEAMAIGLPVITTPVGGIPELLSDGVNGEIIPVGDSFTLGERIKKLACDKSYRTGMGQSARSTVLERLSPHVAGKDLHNVFQSIKKGIIQNNQASL